jgi:hypothetical protein
MDIKSIIKIFFFILIIGLLFYSFIVKIPILCLTCEEPGIFTRCISGTGIGTNTCDAYNLQKEILYDVNASYIKVNDQFGKLNGTFDEAYETIIKAKKTLTDALEKISSLEIPNISSINIPIITDISCSINFDQIPSVDICKTGVTPTVNEGGIAPLNKSLYDLQTQINTFVGQLNNTVVPMNTSINDVNSLVNGIVEDINKAITSVNDITKSNIPSVNKLIIPTLNSNINNATLPQLYPINISCNINIPNLIKEKIGSSTIDICSLLINQINKNLIPQLNDSFKIIGDSINTAIVNINNGIKLAIETIQNSISSAIIMLQNQLDALNIFAKLSEKVVELFSKIENLSAMGIIKTYILPNIKKYFPFTNFSNTLTFLFFLFLIPFIIPLFLIINSSINLIPDINIGGSNND